MTAQQRLIATARAEIGYLEKASNAQLDDKTANAGDRNWTKYARDLDALGLYNGPKNSYAWCDMFCDWCFVKTFGLEKTLVMTGQILDGYGAGCTESVRYYKNLGRFFTQNPQSGDQIFFSKDGGKSFYHTGLVEKVENGRVYTIEGNTSSAAGVVENGGGKNAKTSGYAIGGKTGTAQIYKNGKIESNLHIGSFVGFAPAESPKVALLVTVNEAKVKPDFGGTTAAPFAAQIFEEILPLLGVAKTDGSAEAERVTMPDVTGMDVRDAKSILREAGIDAVTDGESPRVTGQLPPAGTTVQAGFCAMLYVTGETAPQAQDYARVPDVLGLDMRESAQALRLDGFEMNAQGDGLAARQSPIGGSYAPEGTQVLVTFEMP